MKPLALVLFALLSALGAAASFGQVKSSREQMLFFTAEWQGERFADGRPKVSDALLERARNLTIEDVWSYLRQQGYLNQFEGDWRALHPDQTIVGRALTAQYMPARPDLSKAIAAQAKQDGYTAPGSNSWPIAELQPGDVYVADGYGKIEAGTLIGSNLANGIAGRTRAGFIFYGGIRDEEEIREIANFNGLYKGYDPSGWAQEGLTGIDVPIRIGRAVVLPGDLVMAKPAQGVLFVPAQLAEAAISSAEFTKLTDAYNFELNRSGRNGGMFEGGWTVAKYDAFAQWLVRPPQKLQMLRAEFDKLLQQAKDRLGPAAGAGAPPGR